MIFYEILQIFHKRLPVSQLFNVWPLTHREFAILWRVWRHYLSVYRMSPTKGTIKCGWADDKWKEKGDSAAFVWWWQTQRIWDTTRRGTSALSGKNIVEREENAKNDPHGYHMPFPSAISQIYNLKKPFTLPPGDWVTDHLETQGQGKKRDSE